ncbi:unnamed protein product [Chrysoparadoxa australica]
MGGGGKKGTILNGWLPDWLVDYSAFEETENETFKELGLALAINGCVAFFLFTYWTLRRWHNPSFFSCKRAARPPDLAPPQDGPFAWIKSLVNINEAEFLKYAGFDALVYIRMYVLAAKICASFALYGLAVILPINATGKYYARSATSMNNFTRISMSNVEPGSIRLWAHTLGIYLLTAITLFFLNGEFKTYTRLRHAYLQMKAPRMRSIMVTDVPPGIRSNAQLQVYFDALYPGQVESVACIQDLRELQKLIRERDSVIVKLERALWKRKHWGIEVQMRATWFPCPGHQVNAVEHLTQELHFLNEEISREQTRKLMSMKAMHEQLLREVNVPERALRHLHSQGHGSPVGPIERYLTMAAEDDGVKRTRKNHLANIRKMARRVASNLTGTTALQAVASEREDMPLLPEGPISPTFDASGQSVIGGSDHKIERNMMGSRAYVTFTTFRAATIARQVHHSSHPGQLVSKEAPEPRDIYWHNAYVSPVVRARRRIFVDGFLSVLYVFWVIPVTLLYLTFSREALANKYDWIEDVAVQSAMFASLVELLQPVLLLTIMSLLPPLIRILGIVEGIPAESWNQQLGLSRYFYFQVINVFLVNTLAGTVFDTLALIIAKPSIAFTLLGESLPKMCGFFCSYIIIKLLSGLWIEMARVLGAIQDLLLKLFGPRLTPRDKRAVVMGLRPYQDPGWFNYPKVLGQDLLVVMVTMTYACINPFILVIAGIYFTCAHLTYKHQMLYVYEPIYESGGVFFPKIFRRFVFAIMVAQATMVGVLILKGGYYQTTAVGGLMLASWLFKSRQRGYYEPVSLTLPLEAATVLDLEDLRRTRLRQPPGPKDSYVQPALKANPRAGPESDDMTAMENNHSSGAVDEPYLS